MTQSLPRLIAPFPGEHYAALDRLSDLIAPPYDVISPADRTVLAARDPHNIVHVMLPEQGAGDRYAQAAKILEQWRRSGALTRDRDPAVYVLRQSFSTPDGRQHDRTGAFVALAAEPYETGRVRPHERTHSGPKADRLALLEATQTMLESIFVLAPDRSGELRALIADVAAAEPLAAAELNGAALTLWRVTGQSAERIAESASRGPVYIADGHHRFETATAYRNRHPAADRTIALVVPLGDPGLVVLPTHRLIRNGEIGEAKAISALRGHFEVNHVEPELDPVSLLDELGRQGTAGLVVLPGGRILSLQLRRAADLSVLGTGVAARLDVARIDALVVGVLAKLAGPGASVDYTADPAKVFAEAAEGRIAAGVMLNATDVSDVLAVADAGEVMPQKSTYFVPKVPSGLVLLPYSGSGS